MNKESFFLIFSAVGVFPVALAYGAYPNFSLPLLYNIEITSNNLSNVFRAVMGLYVAFNIFWVLGALNSSLKLSAMWSLFIFYSGAGAGRVLSIIFDGAPDIIFMLYLIIEILGSAISFWLIRGFKNN
tara:strand:- start:9 stop:392 length:384 start_codon:yes stop_codon:yes gene_type:complete